MGNQTVDDFHSIGKKYLESQWGPTTVEIHSGLEQLVDE